MDRAGGFLRRTLTVPAILLAMGLLSTVRAQDPQRPPRAVLSFQPEAAPPTGSGAAGLIPAGPHVLVTEPRVAPRDQALPINLPTAMQLAQAAPLDIALA